MRRQTATSGINPAGSSRAERLDPLSLPLSFNAHDVRADGNIRQIELHRERVVLRRAVQGMRMAVNISVRETGQRCLPTQLTRLTADEVAAIPEEGSALAPSATPTAP